MLPCRASIYHLYPLSSLELSPQFDLQVALEWGTLPEVVALEDSAAKREFLTAYTFTYLRQEIGEEQAVRKLEPFRKFLAVASQSNTRIINYQRIANDVGVSPQ